MEHQSPVAGHAEGHRYEQSLEETAPNTPDFSPREPRFTRNSRCEWICSLRPTHDEDTEDAEPMKLPNAHLAIVQQEKVKEYLLNPAHPDNGGKAAFL